MKMFIYKGKKHMIIKQDMGNGDLRGLRIDRKGCVFISVNSSLPQWKQQQVVHDLILNRKLKKSKEL